MTEFREGQRVKVTMEFEGTVALVGYRGQYLDVLPDGGGYGGNDVPVEYIDPKYVTPLVENWPPQIGDVWAVDGAEWFVREHRVGARVGAVVLQPAEAGSIFYHLDNFKALNPVLVRRR